MRIVDQELKCSWLTLLSLVTVIVITGCNANDRFAQAEKASQVFHQRTGLADFDKIYDSTGEDTKKAMKREQFVKFMEQVVQDAGACSSAQLQANYAFITPGGTRVELTYRRQCAKKNLIEQLNWFLTDGTCVLSEFHATPVALN